MACLIVATKKVSNLQLVAGSHDCRVFAAIVGLSAGPLQNGKEGFFKLLEEK